MQEERAILGFLSEALSFELGSSTSIDAVTDHWDHIHSLGDNDLHDYMIANPEPSHEEQHDLHSEASSSGTKNEAASSHSEQRRNEDSEQPPSAPNQHVQNSNPPALSVPPFQWTEVSLADGSSTSTVPPVERNLHLDETRPRSIPESPLFIPAPELRNATSGDLNVASAVSRTGSATGVQPPSYQNLPHQQRRRSELARRSLISSLAGSGDHPTLGASPDGLVLQPGGDRQGDGVAGAHHSFRALAAASRGRSSRLTVSQVSSLQVLWS